MLRMVDLPQPEGPTMATNSPSRISKDAPWTAATSRPSSRNVLVSSWTTMRERFTRSGLVHGLGLLHEGHVHGLGVGNRLVQRQRDPHLGAVVVVLFLDEEVPVEDRPVVLHRAQDDLPRERVHVRLVQQL